MINLEMNVKVILFHGDYGISNSASYSLKYYYYYYAWLAENQV